MSDTVLISLPGKFCAYLDGTNLAQGLDDSDPECKETRIAYDAGTRQNAGNSGGYFVRVHASAVVLRLLAEYAGYCLEANYDTPDKSEVDAAQKVLARAQAAQQKMKEMSTGE